MVVWRWEGRGGRGEAEAAAAEDDDKEKETPIMLCTLHALAHLILTTTLWVT